MTDVSRRLWASFWIAAFWITVSASTGRAVPSVIDTQINPSNQHTYYLLSNATWSEGETVAVSLGGHLASINDAAENAWIFQTFGQSRNLWIGFVDNGGGFQWSDGDPVTYTNWWDLSHGFPVERFTVMGVEQSGSYLGRWDDWQDAIPYPIGNGPIFGVVEVDHLVPEPTTFALLSLSLLGLLMTSKRRAE